MLCWQHRASGAGKTIFICDACLGVNGSAVLDLNTPEFLSQRYQVPVVALSDYEIPTEVRALVSRELCERHTVIPVSRTGDFLILAVTDPSDTSVFDAIAKATGLRVEPVIASAKDIRAALDRASTTKT